MDMFCRYTKVTKIPLQWLALLGKVITGGLAPLLPKNVQVLLLLRRSTHTYTHTHTHTHTHIPVRLWSYHLLTFPCAVFSELRPQPGRQPGGYARNVRFRSLKRSGKHSWPHARVNFGLWSMMFDNTNKYIHLGNTFLFDQSHISWEQRNIQKDHQPDPKVTSAPSKDCFQP